MIKTEYVRFLQTLNADETTDDVRKIANLVFDHIDNLTSLSTVHGKRIKEIVRLSQENWDLSSPMIHPVITTEKDHVPLICELTKLTVGPFRGFLNQEVFDFSSRVTLIYGPNGSGKSSFCEALEYALLGSVSEAVNKRFMNEEDYLRNAHSQTYEKPLLEGLDELGATVPVIANEALQRFSFIEKNRIDDFSRISAKTPAKQTELISTLFGLDDFTEFVRNFTNSMDPYIDLEGEKSKDLDQRKQLLAGFLKDIESAPEVLNTLDSNEKKLADEYKDGYSFIKLVQELHGTDDNEGLIDQLDSQLKKNIGAKSNLTLTTLNEIKESLNYETKELREKRIKLAETSREVSFKLLFEAVIQVKNNNSEACPACLTPLSHVYVNPFEHAASELEKLEHLGELQHSINQTETQIKRLQTKARDIVNLCLANIPDNNQLNELQDYDGIDPIEWWDSLNISINDALTSWQHIEAQVIQHEAADIEINMATENNIINSNELDKLRSFANRIQKLRGNRETTIQTIKQAEQSLIDFSTKNASLIKDVEAEKISISKNKEISNSYAQFTIKLNQYKDSLPAQLVKDLGEIVVDLYNAFNRDDSDFEKLASIKLPLHQNQRLQVSFKNNPEKHFDALHILSEGHIRCIGLAILTAKNIKEKCPFLIFDDPVNAIDDEHRGSIRKTLFNHPHFNDKQIILACHGEEFLIDIQNQSNVPEARKIKTIVFLPEKTGYHIRVEHNCPPRNYIIAARDNLNRGSVRDALTSSRKALEFLTKNKVWPYVSKYSNQSLKINMRSKKSHINLRNLTEQLHSAISGNNFSGPNKNNINEPIHQLLDFNGNSHEWIYLNQGTHVDADQPEFDRGTVIEIVCALEKLDSELPS